MANQFIYELTDTWNQASTTYNAWKMNVADAASAADSKLIDFQVSSSSKFNVDKFGNLVAVGKITADSLKLATPLPFSEGGTGKTTAEDARIALGAASTTNPTLTTPTLDAGANTNAAVLKSTNASGPQIEFQTSGTVTATLLAQASGFTIGTGPGGQTLKLFDDGRATWSGAFLRLTGPVLALEFLELGYDSDRPNSLICNEGTLSWQGAGSANNYWGVGPNGNMYAQPLTGNAIQAAAQGAPGNGGYGVVATSAGNHGIFGRTTRQGYTGVVGQNYNNNFAGYLGMDNWGVYSTGPTFSSGGYQSSDERLKENIEDAPVADILDLIQRLRVVEFDWRENTEAYNLGKRREIGLIAQEVQAVLPRVVLPVTPPQRPVIAGPDGQPLPGPTPTLNETLGTTLTLDSGPLIFYLLAAVQKLASQSGLGSVKTFKADVRRRMTSDENDQFTTALENASSLMRGLWYDVQYLDHSAPEFAEFRGSMIQAFGVARTDVILAPSE